MRFAFEGSAAESVAASWRVLEEPDAELSALFSFPLAFTIGTAVLTLWLVLAPFSPGPVGVGELILLFGLLVPLHELTHAAAFPRQRARRTTIAVSLRRLEFRASYNGDLSRTRLVAVLLMPLFVISVLPAFAAALLGGAFTKLALLSLFNAFVSSGDVLAAILALARIPAGATIRMAGGKTAWRLTAGRSSSSNAA